MQIFSWNIQNGKGCDGIVALQNIIDFIKGNCKPDIICLQEIARHFAEHGDQDQVAVLEAAFDQYTSIWAPGLSWPAAPSSEDHQAIFDGSKRREFGNIVLVKKELLLDFKLHTLPSPAVDGLMQMPRTAIEAIVADGNSTNAVRVLSTHLAFHSYEERITQLDYLTTLKNQAKARAESPADNTKSGCYSPAPSPAGTILCGDLNVALGKSDYQHILDSQWCDAWSALYPEQQHLATCGIYDHQQWSEGAHCRDYFLCSDELTTQLESMHVDIKSAASDHQPLWLNLKTSL